MRRDADAIYQAFETGEYPYKSKMPRKPYEQHKAELQAELLKAQRWVKQSSGKIVIIFEGRDAAGKGGSIKRLVEHLKPRAPRVVALERPTKAASTQRYLQR